MQMLYCGAWSFKAPVRGITGFALQNGRYEPFGRWGAETEAQSILAIAGEDLLAVSEMRGGGKLLRYHIERDGTLTLRSELLQGVPLLSYVCIAPDGRHAFASSMGSPWVHMIRLEEDGGMTLTDRVLLTGHGVTNRQESAKTHCVRVSPDGRLLAVANLGADELELFALDREKETLRLIQSVPVDWGRQPRHLAFSPEGGYLYLLTEAGNRLYVYRVEGERLRELAAYDTLSPDGVQSGMAADLCVRPDGRFLYTSNRAQNNVAVWRVLPSGFLDLAGHAPCGGEGPRGLCISPEGDRLFCANNDSGTVAILPVDRETGLPGAPLQTLALPCAACVRSYSTERNGE